jgi:glucose-1-phosphate thymidylyltransferase
MGNIKGIILAGGTGTRLMPLTKVVNKHLLPIGDKPMLQHCIEKFTKASIDNIMVITGGEHLGGIAEFLGSGSTFGCKVTYRVQDSANGIAGALSLAEGFAGEEPICVILGDNIFKSKLQLLSIAYADNGLRGAMVVLKNVPDPQRFGVATILEEEDRIIKIEEKPKNPESNLAVTGIYFYDKQVFDIIRKCKPSARGELEITDVNNAYIKTKQMHFVKLSGWWTDAGTHESYKKANDLYNGIVTKE